jgi:hypothetical protein
MAVPAPLTSLAQSKGSQSDFSNMRESRELRVARFLDLSLEACSQDGFYFLTGEGMVFQ